MGHNNEGNKIKKRKMGQTTVQQSRLKAFKFMNDKNNGTNNIKCDNTGHRKAVNWVILKHLPSKRV